MPFRYEGLIHHYGDDPAPNCTVFARALSVEVVRYALDVDAVGIVTAAGSFACHAANLLRTERNRGGNIGWIRGIECSRDMSITVNYDGSISSIGGEGAVLRRSTDGRAQLFQFRYADSRAWDRVCLWPDRRYSDFVAGMHLVGLRRSASRLAGEDVRVSADRCGRLWFDRPGLSREGIGLLMLNEARAADCVEQMARAYRDILPAVGCWSVKNLPNETTFFSICDEFFSVLLPFHDEYDRVLLHHANRVHPNGGRRIVAAAANHRVTSWLFGLDEFNSSTKSLHDKRWIGLVPPFAPPGVISERLAELEAAGCAPGIPLEIVVGISVLKEYKMILAKNLFATAGALSGGG